MRSEEYAVYEARTLPASTEAEDRDPLMDLVRRWWWLLLIGVALGVGGAVAYARYGPIPYQTEALIQVQAQTETDPTDNAEQARSATANYAAAAATARTFILAAESLAGTIGLGSEDLLQMYRDGAIVIAPLRNANFISITVQDPDPENAKLIADAIAGALIADVNSRSGEQSEIRRQQLQQQIDFTREKLASAELFQHRMTIEQQLRDERGQLLGLRADYQAEVDTAAFSQVAPSALSESWQALILEQINDIATNIEALEVELAEVQGAIDQLPADIDPALSAALASAYSLELSNLTSQVVSEQLASITAGPPLVQYGDAPAPYPASGIKKYGVIGIAAGGALAAGIAFLLDRLARSRRTRRQELADTVPSEIDQLIANLERAGLTSTNGRHVDRHVGEDAVLKSRPQGGA